MKLEMMVEDCAEMTLMQKTLLLLLLLLLKTTGGLLERGLQLAFSQLALITKTIFRPTLELFTCRIGFQLLH